jgi:hypothetical protein
MVVFDPGASNSTDLVDGFRIHPRSISPDDDGRRDIAFIEWVNCISPAAIRCVICLNPGNYMFRMLLDDRTPPFPDRLAWDGRNDSGVLGACGEYRCYIIAERAGERQVVEGTVTITTDDSDTPIN